MTFFIHCCIHTYIHIPICICIYAYMHVPKCVRAACSVCSVTCAYGLELERQLVRWCARPWEDSISHSHSPHLSVVFEPHDIVKKFFSIRLMNCIEKILIGPSQFVFRNLNWKHLGFFFFHFLKNKLSSMGRKQVIIRWIETNGKSWKCLQTP